jgi:uncharacterized protein YabE (DUF348 family)
MFKALNATIYPEDKYQGFPPPEYGEGSVITVYRAMSVNLIDANEPKTYRTWQKTINDLLVEKNIPLGNQDIVIPDQNTFLVRDMKITLVRVAETDIDEIQPIDFKTKKENTDDLERGTSQVKNEVVEEPVEEIILIGTAPKLISSGKYKDEINSAAKKYDLDAPIIYNLMMLESRGNFDSVNSNGYYGLFQYTEGAWQSMSGKAGYTGASIYDPKAQINVTAWAITHGFKSKWPSL